MEANNGQKPFIARAQSQRIAPRAIRIVHCHLFVVDFNNGRSFLYDFAAKALQALVAEYRSLEDLHKAVEILEKEAGSALTDIEVIVIPLAPTFAAVL